MSDGASRRLFGDAIFRGVGWKYLAPMLLSVKSSEQGSRPMLLSAKSFEDASWIAGHSK